MMLDALQTRRDGGPEEISISAVRIIARCFLLVIYSDHYCLHVCFIRCFSRIQLSRSVSVEHRVFTVGRKSERTDPDNMISERPLLVIRRTGLSCAQQRERRRPPERFPWLSV